MTTSSGLHFARGLFPEAPGALDERPIDVGAMAEYLGVSPHTVRRYAALGDIPAFKVGSRWRFFLSTVRAHLTEPAEQTRWNQSNQSRGRKRLS